MSVATKRKHVVRAIREDLLLPEHEQFIARVLAGRGNNLHEVEDANGESFLVSMPTKFRKNVWIKRGDFVLCEPITEGEKVRAEIVHVLYKENIRHIKQEGLWPTRFDTDSENVELHDNCGLAADMLPPSSSDDSDSDETSSVNSTARKISQTRNLNRGRLFHGAKPKSRDAGEKGSVSNELVVDAQDDSDEDSSASADDADSEDNTEESQSSEVDKVNTSAHANSNCL